MLGFAPDRRQQLLLQRKRRLPDMGHALRLAAAGQLAEDLGHVLGQRFIAGQQAEIRIAARGLVMIVAGTEMHIAPEPSVLAPHHHQDLGVRLEADHAVDHMRPHFL
ncbi:hypothetical protein CBM2637_U10001 [Cupriavidus taiwanensis]|nr:hypothetical protein CBM2637_U10001 [Cupriavidus taiwanensis]